MKPCPEHGRELMYKPDDNSRRQRCASPGCSYDWDPKRDGQGRADGHADTPARKAFHVCGDVIRSDETAWPDGGPWANLGPCADGSPCGMPPTNYVPVSDGWAVVLCTRHLKEYQGGDN